MEAIVHLGEIGAVGGMLRPLDLSLLRDGAVWVLTGYTDPELRVWSLRTKVIVAINGTTTILTPATGLVRYTPGTADPIYANSGEFEGRVWARPGGAGAKEPSGLFRFSIGAGPGPT